MCETIFYEQVTLPYGSQIEKRDEIFFLSDNFVDKVMIQSESNVDLIEEFVPKEDASKESITKLLETIRKVWTTMNETDKKFIWDYMNGLVALSKRMNM